MKIRMKKHSTFNIQLPTPKECGGVTGRSALSVECWVLNVFRAGAAVMLLLASSTFVFAQTNGVPGPADYERFSHFVSDRNIFDPNRQPHSYSPTARRVVRTRTRNEAPGLTLVGTMSYEKGMFAFFNGNSAELKKALRAGDKIADYTVKEIAANRVQLESADKKQQLELKVGDGLRQENGKWVLAGTGELPAATSSAGASSGESSSSAPPPSSAGEPNDVLKRLMQQREKENQ